MKTYLQFEYAGPPLGDGKRGAAVWQLNYAGHNEANMTGQYRACKENLEAERLISCVDVEIDPENESVIMTAYPSCSQKSGAVAAWNLNYLLAECGLPPMFIEMPSPEGVEMVRR